MVSTEANLSVGDVCGDGVGDVSNRLCGDVLEDNKSRGPEI